MTHGKDGAPDRYALNRLTPEEVLASMTTGSMAKYAAVDDRSSKSGSSRSTSAGARSAPATGDASTMPNRCESRPAFEPFTGSEWNGWGARQRQLAIPEESPGLDGGRRAEAGARNGRSGFPWATRRTASRRVVGGRVFVSADTGFVYSLDAETGCVYWSFRANAGVRTAPVIGAGQREPTGSSPTSAMCSANVYAVNAETGAWCGRRASTIIRSRA